MRKKGKERKWGKNVEVGVWDRKGGMGKKSCFKNM